MTDNKVEISPIAVAVEARALNDFYSNRVLILADGLEKSKSTSDGEIKRLSLEVTKLQTDLDRAKTDLNAAKEEIEKLRSEKAVKRGK